MTKSRGIRPRRGSARAFLADVVKIQTDDCVLWPYAVDPKGYGRVNVDGHSRIASRAVALLVFGDPPPDRPLAIHLAGVCHQPRCVNHRHLRWGSYADNEADKVVDQTNNTGDRNGMSKIRRLSRK